MPSLLLALFASTPLSLPALSQHTERVSVSSAGIEADGTCGSLSIAASGRYVAFESFAWNLVPGDTNGFWDIFVHDRGTGQTSRVSVDSSGVQANGGSYRPSISSDGRYVAFESSADNLESGGTAYPGVFVHDLQTGQTTRVSVDSVGISSNSWSGNPSISADGRYVTFESRADNLVPGDSNGYHDIFVHDRETRQTTRVSVHSSGAESNRDSELPSISADGCYVTFESWADNLVPGDTNLWKDIFIHDRQTGQTARVSLESGGLQANRPSVRASSSADGRFVAFQSAADNLVPGDLNGSDDIFVHDRQTGITTRVSVEAAGLSANHRSSSPRISADGRYVAFHSAASNLVPGDTNGKDDVFVYDRQDLRTTRVSVDSFGTEVRNHSGSPDCSFDGRHVAFFSHATSLVSGDTNRYADIFVHDRQLIAPTLSVSGSCPGPMTLHMDAVSPEGHVVLALGGAGSFTIPSGPCAGSTLDLASPRLGPVIRASWFGSSTRSYATTPALCGRTAQALDLRTCKTSNTVVL